MGKTITKSAPRTNDEAPITVRRSGRVLKVSTAELNGIRNILANPEPPTPELKAAWADYIRHTTDNPDSNW